MGELICVCKEADGKNCDKCNKHKRIKPDQTFKCPTWKKDNKPDTKEWGILT